MKINWKVRLKNPVFWVQLVLAMAGPVLAYMGLTAADLTSWPALGGVLLGAAKNPYVLGLAAVSLWNALNDPTTKGVQDSARAMGYEEPG